MATINFTCIVCGNDKYSIPYSEKFNVLECTKCKFGIIDPIPVNDVLVNLYNTESYFNTHMQQEYEALNEQELTESVNKQGTFHFQYLDKILKQNSSVLEIGPGYGLQLKYLSNAGYKVKGVETSENAVSFIKNKLGLKVERSSLEDYEDKTKYDILMLNHVLEHYRDLHIAMLKITSLIKIGGHIYLRVPNHDSYDRRKMKKEWPAYLPFHISYFSKKSLKILLTKYNFELICMEEYVSDTFLQKIPKYFKKFIKYFMFIFGISPYINGRTITIIAKYNA